MIHQTLRALPDRRAPRSLESRVLAALAARAALPWWRQSFARWPVAVRCGFLLFSGGLVKAVLMLAVWAMGGFERTAFVNAFDTQFAWVAKINGAVAGIADIASLVYHAIPPVWLYGGLAVFACVYLALFGLGATAYRTLYANR